ncbi:hypothetical protein [Salinilacihabitans rarus]|uniref:DUF5789 family protein n=1 Tax=Salinilacihabitans rarus TaxID=2961596 RepID=UPI0020C913AA|nr:hypothetical protein [Salinilacihabitans rarus]
MGVRPPTNGDDDATGGIEFGIAAVDALLKRSELSFPASSDDVAAELGHERVPCDAYGNDVSLGEVLAEVDRDRFDSRQQLLNDLHPVFEEYRKRRSGGVVKQVRSLLPF